MGLARQVRNHISAVRRWSEFFAIEKDRHVRRAANYNGFHTHKIPATKAANHDQKQQNQNDRAKCTASWFCWLIFAGCGVKRNRTLRSRLDRIVFDGRLGGNSGWPCFGKRGRNDRGFRCDWSYSGLRNRWRNTRSLTAAQ